MSNSTANVRAILRYPQPGGGICQPPIEAILALYAGSNVAEIDVPDLEAAITKHAVPFGDISEASMVMIQNLTGQDLDVIVNDTGADIADHSIPIGGLWLCGGPVPAVATFPMTRIDLVTTAEQAGAGRINCWVFGDPEVTP